MAYKIIQSKIFLKRVIELNIYLEKNWGLDVAKRFHAKLVKTILILSGNPGIGSLSKKKKGVHKILVTKHNRLYYKINDNSITLLTLFDTRLNPKKNSFE
jgi:plasmid stabilization system protein ParE